MATFDTAALLAPQAVMLVGASRDQGSVGGAILNNLVKSDALFRLYAINPHFVEVKGAFWCPDIASVPEPCELAIVTVPAKHVLDVIAELGANGTRLAVIISSGLNDENGLKAELLKVARECGVRILGPNCLGVLIPRANLNASFAPTDALPGNLALLSQSGALVTAMLDWAKARNIGFSAVLSIGDMADVGLPDLVAAFGDDHSTDAILIYLEGLEDGLSFLQAVREVQTRKPVIVLKAGRSQAAARAAKSHTGALAGSYDVYRAAFRQTGIVIVEALDELFDAASVLSSGKPCAGNRLGIVSNGGGAGILAVDELSNSSARLAVLAAETISHLDHVLPAGWSRANPVDIIGDAPAERYRSAIEAVLADEGVDVLLVMNCPTALTESDAVVREVVRTVEMARTNKPVFACWLGESNAGLARDAFRQAGITLFETPNDAVRGVSYLAQGAAKRDKRVATSIPSDAATIAEAKHLIADVRADGRKVMSELEAKKLLSLFGVPVVPTERATTPQDVAEACQLMSAPYVVKIVSPDLTHKSDIGGVALGLADPQAAEAAAQSMLERIRTNQPQARLQGFSVQPMIRRKQAHELFAGIATDPTFGSILMVGAGGTAVEVLADRSIRLPPLGPGEAEAMLAETRISRLLSGYRDVPATKRDAIIEALLALSDLCQALPEIAELDVNPLLADADGVIALDARVILSGSH